MKRIIIITIITFLALVFPGCKKSFLEIQPSVNLLQNNFYQTENDALYAVAAAYKTLVTFSWCQPHFMDDIMSDDAYNAGGPGGVDTPYWQQMESWALTSNNDAVIALWSREYTGIYRANQLLDEVDNIKWTSDAHKKRIIAECKFLRAYYYWELVRFYGWVPLVTKLYSSDELIKIPQSEPTVIYKQIATDLLEATADLPATIPPSETGRASKFAAESLIARIFLYYEGYCKSVPELGITTDWTNNDGSVIINKAKVKDLLNDIISNGNFDLMPTYPEMVSWSNDHNTKEDIFAFQYSDKQKLGSWGDNATFTGNFNVICYGPRNPVCKTKPDLWDQGWSFNTPTWSLRDEFEANDTIRLRYSLFNAKDSLTSYTHGFQNTGYFNFKYMARTGFKPATGVAALNYNINYADIRYPEVLLMAAEVFMTDDPTFALSCLNKVRVRAMGDKAALTADKLTIDAIYHERRVELSGEGHRYYDLLRRGLDYTKEKIDATFDPAVIGKYLDSDNSEDFAIPRYFDKATLGMFPIPQTEIDVTNGLYKQFVPAYK